VGGKASNSRCFPTFLSFPAGPDGKVAADLRPCGTGKVDLLSIGGKSNSYLNEVWSRDDSRCKYNGIIVWGCFAEIGILGLF
jgi:hypothetical protein